jgi:hypothetical protein
MTYDGDKFDDIIDDAAREYNRAPEAPRAEMWERIQAARARNAASPSVPVTPLHPATAPVVATPASRPDIVPIHVKNRRPLWWAAGLAATLLLGIGIGRMMERTGSTQPGTDAAQRVAQVPTRTPDSGRGPDSATLAVPGGTPSSNATEPLSGSNGGTRRSVTGPNGSAQVVEATIASRYQRGAEQAAERRAAEVALPYRLAAAEHLAMTEALLVSFRADYKSGRRDSTVASWATNLLGTTRMLIDSPASKDLKMKKLLEDLELVLAQIARLPAASGDSTDVELIDKAVKERQVLTRLRAMGPRT